MILLMVALIKSSLVSTNITGIFLLRNDIAIPVPIVPPPIIPTFSTFVTFAPDVGLGAALAFLSAKKKYCIALA